MILLNDVLGNASLIELAWILTAAAGIFVAGLNALEATGDFRALGGVRNGRRRIAIGTIRREIIRMFVNVLFLPVGVVAAFIPANPHSTWLGVYISLTLLLASVAYNANSLLDRADRKYLMRYGIQARDEHGRFTKN